MQNIRRSNNYYELIVVFFFPSSYFMKSTSYPIRRQHKKKLLVLYIYILKLTKNLLISTCYFYNKSQNYQKIILDRIHVYILFFFRNNRAVFYLYYIYTLSKRVQSNRFPFRSNGIIYSTRKLVE